MTLHAESAKYCARQIAVVPEPDGTFTLFLAAGSTRTILFPSMSGEALLEWLASDFAANVERSEAERIRHSRRPPPIDFSSLDLPVDVLALDLGIEL